MPNLFTNLISRISLVELLQALSSISSRKNAHPAETSNRIGTGDKDKKTFAEIIREASARYGVDESVIRAVIKQESSFNPEAVSGLRLTCRSDRAHAAYARNSPGFRSKRRL